ncbi:hypothetical protein P4197_25935 [Pseudomonas aeruginosa]|nr:hypothetical protein [Pseudomonas aeruginosa]
MAIRACGADLGFSLRVFSGAWQCFLSIAMGGAGFCILLGRWLIPLDVLVFDVTFTLLLHRLL